MPGYTTAEKRHLNRKAGKWERIKKEQAFDYDSVNKKSWGLLISFFRFYPDYFLDLLRSPNAPYKLELPQRLMLRVQARYQNTYITGARGIAKTFTTIASKMIDGVLYPNEKMRYFAPTQKQSATLASQTFATLKSCYPLLASWWNENNNRGDMFRISTDYGSEFTMYAPRGDNFNSVVAEEMAQVGEDGFDFTTFEEDVQKGHRLIRTVNGVKDKTRVQLKFNCISNASSRQNKAFFIYRKAALDAMRFGDKYDGFCMDISWKSALLCNLRDIAYYKKEKRTTSAETWKREMEALYTGADENPMVADETLTRSRTLMLAENEHCGDENVWYVIAHDVSYADGRHNAKCADVVLKCTAYTTTTKRDKLHKQVVWLDNYNPPATDFLQGQRVKRNWLKFNLTGGKATVLCVDAHAYGTAVVEELLKESTDGTPTLRTINSSPLFSHIEQPNALPVVYPLKATTSGGIDADGEMIQYAQNEFEQGNIELLTGNILDGVESYKRLHNIKDDFADGKIALPYKMTDLLCQQIANLKTEVSGLSLKEKRKSKAIQRDLWSALKYALWMAKKIEDDLKKERYKAKSSWAEVIAQYDIKGTTAGKTNNSRAALLGLRKR